MPDRHHTCAHAAPHDRAGDVERRRRHVQRARHGAPSARQCTAPFTHVPNSMKICAASVATLRDRHTPIHRVHRHRPPPQATLNDVVGMCSALAMEHLARGDALACQRMLERGMALVRGDDADFNGDAPHASAALRPSPALEILMWNGAACMHRRGGAARAALACLQKVLDISAATGVKEGLVTTNLNICAVLSQAGRHERALKHAQRHHLRQPSANVQLAAFQAQEELSSSRAAAQQRPLSAGDGSKGAKSSKRGARQAAAAAAALPQQRERLTNLAVAYYNLAVELEHTQHGDLSLPWYAKAIGLLAEGAEEQGAISCTTRPALRVLIPSPAVTTSAVAQQQKRQNQKLQLQLQPQYSHRHLCTLPQAQGDPGCARLLRTFRRAHAQARQLHGGAPSRARGARRAAAAAAERGAPRVRSAQSDRRCACVQRCVDKRGASCVGQSALLLLPPPSAGRRACVALNTTADPHFCSVSYTYIPYRARGASRSPVARRPASGDDGRQRRRRRSSDASAAAEMPSAATRSTGSVSSESDAQRGGGGARFGKRRGDFEVDFEVGGSGTPAGGCGEAGSSGGEGGGEGRWLGDAVMGFGEDGCGCCMHDEYFAKPTRRFHDAAARDTPPGPCHMPQHHLHQRSAPPRQRPVSAKGRLTGQPHTHIPSAKAAAAGASAAAAAGAADGGGGDEYWRHCSVGAGGTNGGFSVPASHADEGEREGGGGADACTRQTPSGAQCCQRHDGSDPQQVATVHNEHHHHNHCVQAAAAEAARLSAPPEVQPRAHRGSGDRPAARPNASLPQEYQQACAHDTSATASCTCVYRQGHSANHHVHGHEDATAQSQGGGRQRCGSACGNGERCCCANAQGAEQRGSHGVNVEEGGPTEHEMGLGSAAAPCDSGSGAAPSLPPEEPEQWSDAVAAASVLQATWRGHASRREQQHEVEAVASLQACWRGHAARQASHQHETAAIDIQRVREEAAVVVLQTAVRRIMAQRHAAALRWKAVVRALAATRVQSAWRGAAARRSLQLEQGACRDAQRAVAATTIQSAQRGRAQRRALAQQRRQRQQQQHAAATRIQAQVRQQHASARVAQLQQQLAQQHEPHHRHSTTGGAPEGAGDCAPSGDSPQACNAPQACDAPQENLALPLVGPSEDPVLELVERKAQAERRLSQGTVLHCSDSTRRKCGRIGGYDHMSCVQYPADAATPTYPRAAQRLEARRGSQAQSRRSRAATAAAAALPALWDAFATLLRADADARSAYASLSDALMMVANVAIGAALTTHHAGGSVGVSGDSGFGSSLLADGRLKQSGTGLVPLELDVVQLCLPVAEAAAAGAARVMSRAEASCSSALRGVTRATTMLAGGLCNGTVQDSGGSQCTDDPAAAVLREHVTAAALAAAAAAAPATLNAAWSALVNDVLTAAAASCAAPAASAATATAAAFCRRDSVTGEAPFDVLARAAAVAAAELSLERSADLVAELAAACADDAASSSPQGDALFARAYAAAAVTGGAAGGGWQGVVAAVQACVQEAAEAVRSAAASAAGGGLGGVCGTAVERVAQTAQQRRRGAQRRVAAVRGERQRRHAAAATIQRAQRQRDSGGGGGGGGASDFGALKANAQQQALPDDAVASRDVPADVEPCTRSEAVAEAPHDAAPKRQCQGAMEEAVLQKQMDARRRSERGSEPSEPLGLAGGTVQNRDGSVAGDNEGGTALDGRRREHESRGTAPSTAADEGNGRLAVVQPPDAGQAGDAAMEDAEAYALQGAGENDALQGAGENGATHVTGSVIDGGDLPVAADAEAGAAAAAALTQATEEHGILHAAAVPAAGSHSANDACTDAALDTVAAHETAATVIQSAQRRRIAAAAAAATAGAPNGDSIQQSGDDAQHIRNSGLVEPISTAQESVAAEDSAQPGPEDSCDADAVAAPPKVAHCMLVLGYNIFTSKYMNFIVDPHTL
ncbi:hypothetical protein JKP88DRAFT_244065 [Tribonema minus]|uniref:Uncharacterized protein n=1 Tax=Tribonema minus TaxID=303371 RepID=A0A835Z4J0_9STRA|nr:hypothetical protein JKP88DRAFT_244065 [Tribonema minus]